MILRADYLQNRYARAIANRQILKAIAREMEPGNPALQQINNRLSENLTELKAVKFGMKSINIKPLKK
ncbi:MAG: hypothetical protein HC906_16270 [Bacteroidales bacterium]|nr:hypothetical protein [Bacteroidales bacterium]